MKDLSGSYALTSINIMTFNFFLIFNIISVEKLITIDRRCSANAPSETELKEVIRAIWG